MSHDNFVGLVIEESLENKSVLKKVKVLSTEVVKVREEHKTPWLSQWTMHTIQVQQDQARSIAEEISRSIDSQHSGSWYADFKNDTHHYIVFRGRIFYIDRQNKEQYNEAKRYGISLGIPKHQVDF